MVESKPVWENLQDGTGARYGRRLRLQTGGWLYQPSVAVQGWSAPSFAFVPDQSLTPSSDMSQILTLLQSISGVVNSIAAIQSPVPDPRIGEIFGLVQSISEVTHTMSGTVSSVDDAIAELKADIAAESAAVDQAIVMIQGIPAAIAAAVAQATAAGATAEQLAAFDALHTSITEEGAKLVAALPQPQQPDQPPPPDQPPAAP
jgi:hypothetical protein